MNNPMSQFEGLDTEFLLFTKDVCGYCVAAKNLLNSKGLTFTEVNPTARSRAKECPDHRDWPQDSADNFRPQVGRLICWGLHRTEECL